MFSKNIVNRNGVLTLIEGARFPEPRNQIGAGPGVLFANLLSWFESVFALKGLFSAHAVACLLERIARFVGLF